MIIPYRLYRMKESGILNHMYLHGLSNYTKCLQPGLVSPSKSLRPFELEDFYGVFCVYFGGEALFIFSYIEKCMCESMYVYVYVFFHLESLSSPAGVVFSVLVFLLELAVPLKHFSSNVCRGGKADRGHAEPNPPSLASA